LLPRKRESACVSVPTDTRVKEAYVVKKLKCFCLGMLTFSLLAMPALAQKNRSNKGGAARGDVRADAVQSATKKDKDRDPSPDNDKNKGKHKGETKGKHKAKGHRH